MTVVFQGPPGDGHDQHAGTNKTGIKQELFQEFKFKLQLFYFGSFLFLYKLSFKSWI